MVRAARRVLDMFHFKLADLTKANMKFFRELTFYALAMVMTFHFSQLRFGLSGQPLENNIYHLMEGTGSTPLQHRVLIPGSVNLILTSLTLLPSVPVIAPESIFQYIELLSVFLLFVAVRHYVSLFLDNDLVGILSSILTFNALLFSYVMPRASPLWYVHWFPFDIPAVLFITVGLILIYQKKWTQYYLVFLVATVNRETSCFLTVAYLLTSLSKWKTKQVTAHCLLQFLIWATIKYILFRIYSDNPVGDGGLDPTKAHWSLGLYDPNDFAVNLETLISVSAYPFIFSITGFLWVPTMLLLRRVREEFVRRSMVVTVPWCLSMLYAGTLTQLREFGELVPFVGVAFMLALQELLRMETGPSNRGQKLQDVS